MSTSKKEPMPEWFNNWTNEWLHKMECQGVDPIVREGFKKEAQWLFERISSQPSPGLRWVKASEVDLDIISGSVLAKIADDEKVMGRGKFQLSDGTFFWGEQGFVPVLKRFHCKLLLLVETPSVQPIEGEQKADDDGPLECDFGGCEVPEGAKGITNCVHCGGELKQVGRCWYHWSSFVDGNLLPDAIVQDMSPEEAQPIADHVHVQLESGAVATVSPDASPELLGALNTMAKKAMQMPIADKGVGPLEIHEGEFDEQAIKIASRVASAFNEELEKMYADLSQQLEDAKNLIEGFVRIYRAEGNKGGAPKNIINAIKFLAQFPETPQTEK